MRRSVLTRNDLLTAPKRCEALHHPQTAEPQWNLLLHLNNKKSYLISKYNRPILASDLSDNFIILCGNKYIKYYNYSEFFYTKDKNSIKKSLVELSKLKDCSFVNVTKSFCLI